MSTVNFRNTIVLLIGFAGTGKYTIGRELCERTGAKLIDNHLINNPVFKVVNADGVTPLPAEVWDKVKAIRGIVYDTMRELSPADLSFVFTIELIDGKPGEQEAFAELEKLAATRQSLFVPVRLICDADELCRRVVSPGRIAMIKSISPEAARKQATEYEVLKVEHANLRTLDVTRKSPGESADAILAEITDLLRID